MKMGKDETIGRFAVNATYAVIVENLMKGYRVDLGWITLSPRIKGAVRTVDATPDSSAIEISASLSKELRKCAQNLVPVNENVKAATVLYELQEVDCPKTNTLHEPGKRIVLNGSGLTMNLSNPDEGIWLETELGATVARADILEVNAATCYFKFDELPPRGKYVLVVSARNGLPTSYAPNRRTRRVKVI